MCLWPAICCGIRSRATIKPAPRRTPWWCSGGRPAIAGPTFNIGKTILPRRWRSRCCRRATAGRRCAASWNSMTGMGWRNTTNMTRTGERSRAGCAVTDTWNPLPGWRAGSVRDWVFDSVWRALTWCCIARMAGASRPLWRLSNAPRPNGNAPRSNGNAPRPNGNAPRPNGNAPRPNGGKAAKRAYRKGCNRACTRLWIA